MAQAVTSVDADIIFKKITGTINHAYQQNATGVAYGSFKAGQRKQPTAAIRNSSINRMDFENFILALSEIADLMYRQSSPSQDSKLLSFQMLFADHLVPLDDELQITNKSAISSIQGQIESLKDSLRDPQTAEVLESVRKSMYPYFKCYADPRTELLNLQSFSKFCTDFEIFPEMVSKPKIMRIFEALSGYYPFSVTMGAMHGKLDATGSLEALTPSPGLARSRALNLSAEILGSLTPENTK